MPNETQSASDLDLINKWLSGDQQAATNLHEQYFRQVLRLVERNTAQRFASKFDAEDVAQSIFRSMFRGLKDGRFNPENSDEVWGLLRNIALWKVRNRVKYHSAGKRSVDKEDAASVILTNLSSPGEDDASELMEVLNQVIASLREPEQRTLELVIQEKSNQEIADALNVTTKSVQRYRKRIQDKLSGVLAELAE
ncbi:MAG: RNA polymerase sigma factor [Planctomycetaceae bacterium]